MIDRRPDDWKPERHVDRSAEREQLHGNQSLIVITRHDGIELAASGAPEDGVAWERSVDIDSAASRLMNGGAQGRFIL